MMRTSKEVAEELSLSKRRVNQAAKNMDLKKVGTQYCWNKTAIEKLRQRIGKRGIKNK